MISTVRFSSSLLLLTILMAGNASFAQLPSPAPDHVVFVIEENYSYSQILGPGASAYAPYLNSLVGNPFSANFTQSFAMSHPSEPNYLYLYSGSNQGVTNDGYPTGQPFTTPNLGSQLITAGKSFKTYSENMPSVGYDGTSSGNYWRKHNPCTNWVVASGTPGTNQYGPSVNVPMAGYWPSAADYSTLPTVSYLVPNGINDMHDGSYPSNISIGDTWCRNHVDSLLTWALANNTLVIIIFDEDDNAHSNNIATIFYGPMIKGGNYSEHINFCNVLRTVEDLYSLPYAGCASTATTITDCWRSSGTGAWLGTNNISNNFSFTVAPNPANELVNFTTDMPMNEGTTITITDALGRLAGSYTMNGYSLSVNTRDYAAGMYIYKAINENNNLVREGKFIVSHN